MVIYILFIFTYGIFYNDYTGKNLTVDDLLFAESTVGYAPKFQTTANVSTTVDTRMIVPISNPCKNPYDMVCSKWTKPGSYLSDNAEVIQYHRTSKKIKHVALKHPWISQLYTQCMNQLSDPYNAASLLYIKNMLYKCEPSQSISSTVEQNLFRVACFEKEALFPVFDRLHGNNTVQPSVWIMTQWSDKMISEVCTTVTQLFQHDKKMENECIQQVKSMISVLKHFESEVFFSTLLHSEWNTLTLNRYPMPNALDVTPVCVWNKEMLNFILRMMGDANFKWFIHVAVVGDLLQLVGYTGHHMMYNQITSVKMATGQKAYPPSIYGWGPVGYDDMMEPHRNEDETDHPDLTGECLIAIGDIVPQVIDITVYPCPRVVERATAVIEAVRTRYIDALTASDDLTDSFKKTIVNRVKTMAFDIGNSRNINIQDKIGSTFVESAMAARRFNADPKNHATQNMPGNFHFSTFNAVYNPETNRVFLPTVLILSPYFNASDPAELHYGRLGFIAAHELAHVFDPEVLMKLHIASGLDVKNMYNSIRCFNNMIPDFGAEETLQDVMGFEMALQACQQQKGCNDLAKKQTFFNVFGQTLCSNAQVPNDDPHKTPRFRVNTATLLARNLGDDKLGFAKELWYCSKPPSCAFWY